MQGEDPIRWAEIAALTALVHAGLSFLAWLFHLSALMSFVSETILLGFKTGAALTIVAHVEDSPAQQDRKGFMAGASSVLFRTQFWLSF